MILKKMEVENFRLLKKFELNFKDKLSLIIGKNNSGKTSVLVILNKMLNSHKITWEDVNLEWQKELYDKISKFNDEEREYSNFLEALKLRLYIEYEDNDYYTNIQKFMMDLNPKNNNIVLEFVSLISAKNITKLKKIIKEKQIKNFISFSKFISKNFTDFFEVKKYSRAFDEKSKKITQDISEEIDNRDIQKVIKIAGIRADRTVSNDERNHVLSNLAEKYYSSYKNIKNESDSIFALLEEELEKADDALYKIYNGEKIEGRENSKGIFSNIIDVIKMYGGIEKGIQISIESSISEKNLLSDNTKLSYKQGNDCSLPETYNGLGYLNLIGILFEIETKIQWLYEQPADINILYIEEPEAHTHPQLQYIFIRNIKDHIDKHRNQIKKIKEKHLQILITSHSSHIVSVCDFEDIIYLKKNENFVSAKSFNSLEKEYKGDKHKGFKFVKQYLTVNRSELFFADKVICIEGDTERILMPMMMSKVDKKEAVTRDEISLLSQNISIIEVGAHAHTFTPLFSFLGTKVLIITDIDSAKVEKVKNKLKSCHPRDATHTNNASIRDFFKEDNLDMLDNQFLGLIAKKNVDKIKNNIRIAYQIPEVGDTYQASSFEDAFISLNKDFILKNKGGFFEYGALKNFDDIEGDIYQFAHEKVKKKSAFASSILYFDEDNMESSWQVPYYIKEGLLWIRKN